jgi:hypothetical protein
MDDSYKQKFLENNTDLLYRKELWHTKICGKQKQPSSVVFNE